MILYNKKHSNEIKKIISNRQKINKKKEEKLKLEKKIQDNYNVKIQIKLNKLEDEITNYRKKKHLLNFIKNALYYQKKK